MDKEIENPKPKKGETQKKFISRCIPIVHKEHPSWSMDKVKRVCYEIWRDRNKESLEAQGYTLFASAAQLITVPKQKDDITIDTKFPKLTGKNTPIVDSTKRLVAIIGNRFMNGGFVSAEELKKCYKGWEGSLHDINHMGTSTGFFLVQSDITYFIGYHDDVKYDKTNNSVSMNLHIHTGTKFAKAWEAYVELCEMAGKIPNVSVVYYGKQKFIPASDLPKDVDWEAEGYGKDDLVPVLYNIIPVCVSTVLRGRCDDKDGCGIRDTASICGSDSCDCGKCKRKDTELDEKIEKQRQELIALLKADDD